MCEPVTLMLMVASTVVSAVGGMAQAEMTSAAAESEAAYRNYQIEIQNRQLAEDKKQAEIQALQQENARQDASRRARATNEAFIASSGVGENISFLQGAEVVADQNLRRDVASMRLNAAIGQNRIADQIMVNKTEGQFATAKAGMTSQGAYIGAVTNIASTALSNAYRYKTGRV
jgi:hypothetical protein